MAAVGQVGEEAVEAHYGFAGDSPHAQRRQMQALFSASAGIRSPASGAISAVKHQQGCVAVAGSLRAHWLGSPQIGQRLASGESVITASVQWQRVMRWSGYFASKQAPGIALDACCRILT